jgi:DNA-binding response OmpR family regulator
MNVLLVEDHEDTLDMLSSLVQSCGHNAIPASTCAEALRLLDSVRPEVIVCDLSLPDCDGLSLVGKAKKSHSKIWTIALTARASDKDRELGLKAGFDHYLSKPMDVPKLRKLLCGDSKSSPRTGPLRAA